jgi:membrane-anchored mycosin MYCP
MSRIAAMALGLALVVAAQAPATAATVPGERGGTGREAGARAAAGAPAAAKPSPKPTTKPSPRKSRPAAPVLQALPVEPRPTPNSPDCPTGPFSRRATTEPWAQQALDFSSAWPLTQGQGVTVAVVDSGVDYTPQLAGKVDAFNATSTGFQDCVGHGTAVAAIIAARNLQAQGVPFEGVAPRARILSVKVTNADTSSPATTGGTNTLAQGIIAAADLGAQVINVSVQTSQNTAALSRAVRFALSRGAVIVAAGGNDGPGTGTGPFYPASYPGVLSVGAVESDGSLAPFSDLGSNVAVTAPGVNVTSAWPGGFRDDDLSGTSFAAPFVSGVAALVRSRFPGLSGAAVVQRIEATANGGTGPGTGDGLVNPLEAVTAILPPAAAPSVSAAARPQPVSVPRAPPPDQAARTIALTVTAGALGAAALVALGAVVISRGRRRRWRAGRARIPADDGPVADGPPPTSSALFTGERRAELTGERHVEFTGERRDAPWPS